MAKKAVTSFLTDLEDDCFAALRGNLAVASFAYSDGVLSRDTFRGIAGRELFLNGRERMSLLRLLLHSITQAVVPDKETRTLLRCAFEMIILFNAILRGRVTLAAKRYLFNNIPLFMQAFLSCFPTSIENKSPKFHSFVHLLFYLNIFGSLANIAVHIFEAAHSRTKLDALHLSSSASVALSLVTRFVRRFTAASLARFTGAPTLYLSGSVVPDAFSYHVWGTLRGSEGVPLSIQGLELLWVRFKDQLVRVGTQGPRSLQDGTQVEKSAYPEGRLREKHYLVWRLGSSAAVTRPTRGCAL